MAFRKKKTEKCWIWLAVDRLRNATIAFKLGCRGIPTLKQLWKQVAPTMPLVVATDYWQAYPAVIPPEVHLVTKEETHTVEGKNAQIRHCLARFKRKTFCYSKSWQMVALSLKLLFALKLS